MTAFDDGRSISRASGRRARRLGQRAEVLWKGDYLVVDPLTSLIWPRCYLVGLSESGAAIEVHGDDVDVGHRILLRLDPHPSYHDSWLQLRARVVNRRGSSTPAVYGLVFTGMIASQRDHLLQIAMTARRNRRRRRRYRPDA